MRFRRSVPCSAIRSTFAAAALALAASCAPLGASEHAPHSRTQLVMLGTGNPAPDPDRFGPATVVLVDDVPYLIDCGVGVVRRWAAAIREHRLHARVTDLKTAFVTHLHSDHTLGLAELVLTPWTIAGDARFAKRGAGDGALEIHGPKGLARMTAHLLAAYDEDIRIRTGPGGENAGGDPPRVQVHEIDAGVVFRDERVTVTAFRVRHGTWREAFGFRFDTPDATLVITGDTAYTPEVAAQCRRCDILVHEGGVAGDPSAYFRAFHSSAEDVARTANAARPRLLVLYHQRGSNAAGLAAIRARYPGPVVVARDLQRFDVGALADR
jgi:ribonuclease Z